MMHLLERIARTFNAAGAPLMALKGAALNLAICDGPGERAMSDLDLMIRPEHLDAARKLLEELGCLRGPPLVREDYFPRYYYETEYTAGAVWPMKIDLHVRPFRPLRYSRFIPPNAIWERAQTVRIGQASILIPAAEDMLIHLAVHAAIHGYADDKWIADIHRWADRRGKDLAWDRLAATAASWRLSWPVLHALRRADEAGAVEAPGQDEGGRFPRVLLEQLAGARKNWRDRLALWHAPRDAAHPVRHVAVNVLTTPGATFALGYLWSVLVPAPQHMEECYRGRHRGWLLCAHLARWARPLLRRIPSLGRRFEMIETSRSAIHGLGVFATRRFDAGELIARYRGQPVDRQGLYVGHLDSAGGTMRRYEITGRLKFLNHACRPNAELAGFRLIARRPIRDGEEITINYGVESCGCHRGRPGEADRSLSAGAAEAA
jgi:hypothetical protein